MEQGLSSSIKVHKSVIPQLVSELSQAKTAWLIGLHRTSSILSCVQKKDSSKDNEELTFIQTHVPNGLDVLGIGIQVGDNEDFNPTKLTNTLSGIKSTFEFANFVATLNVKSQELKLFTIGKDKLESISFELGGNEYLSGVSVWYCEAKIPITACYQDGFFKDGLSQSIDSVVHDLKSDSTCFLVNNSIIFSRNQGELLNYNKGKMQNNNTSNDTMTCTLVQNRSAAKIRTSPYIHYAAVVYAYAEETLAQIAEKLVLALSCQVRSISTVIINTPDYLKIQVTPYHYLNNFNATYITVLYPVRSTEPNEDHLLPFRQDIHTRFGLPNDRPLVRLANSVPFAAEEPAANKSKHIMDVHKVISLTPQVSGGTQYFVEGCYEYYHYSQDNFNDNGWGCAYRSMQTLCSWFKLQQYIQSPVPTHPEIQTTLVKIGDKPKSFIGSTNWIGAIEISLCLQHLYGITCNIMHIGSGSEIVTKARELSVHFQTNGTPVMIGGGVLAYTLLGIDWNEKTGDIKFLILDPHYVGIDDLKTIKEKGWCGWKTADLFRKDSFYNLCLPQRPKQI